MIISHFVLGGCRCCGVCLPAGLDRAPFTSRVFAQLQQKVGPSCVVVLTYKGSTAVYHNAPAELIPSVHLAAMSLRCIC